MILIAGCQKENPTTPPTVTTTEVSNISTTAAICGGEITSIGGQAITEQGVCWSTSENPSVDNQKKSVDLGLRTFTTTINGLTSETTYHVRAYATNPVGTSYGEDVSFTTTAIPLPAVTTTAISNISYTTATSGGEITSSGGASISAKGVCWSTSANPTIADSKTTDGTGTATFVSSLTGLTANTTYHVRAYATNVKGTAYGADVTFTTLTVTLGAPTLTTVTVTSITATTAVSGGTITSDGGAAITAKGVCWGSTSNPTIANSKTTDGTGSASFVSNITGLSASTTYHLRAYATNSSGTAYGNDVTFTTPAVVLPVSTQEENKLLGNPSNATTNTANTDYFTNYLLVKPQYTLSFNNTTHNCNWVSWHLYSGDLGSAPRTDAFTADASLPAGFYQVGNWDYSYATYGFERGHMCPSADRTATAEYNASTFVMSNAIPQSPNCNGIVWGALEDYCRTLVNQGNELYIICGPYGQGGTAKPNGTGPETSANFVNNNAGGTNIVVPAQVWKIVVVIPNGNDDISRITSSTRVIAVKMPNTVGCSAYDWKYYRTSVDALETLTGYDFLSNVPTGIQAVIEASVDAL